MLKICGLSDDIISLDGDVTEELYPELDDDGHVFLFCSDGTVIEVCFDGSWTFRRVVWGESRMHTEPIDPNGDSPHSEVITLSYGDNHFWVALAKAGQWASAQPYEVKRVGRIPSEPFHPEGSGGMP